jgi:hypothetical protein
MLSPGGWMQQKKQPSAQSTEPAAADHQSINGRRGQSNYQPNTQAIPPEPGKRTAKRIED